jgi:hypothetical protein
MSTGRQGRSSTLRPRKTAKNYDVYEIIGAIKLSVVLVNSPPDCRGPKIDMTLHH